MPREATGQVVQYAHGYSARIRVDSGTKGRRSFPIAVRDEAAAEARRELLANMAKRLKGAAPPDEIAHLLEIAARARSDKALKAAQDAADAIARGGTTRTVAAMAPTFEAFAKEWTDGVLHRRYPDHVKEKRTASRDAELLRLYILPVARDIRLPDFELAHAEAVMAMLPAALSSATRRHVAQVISRVLRLAVYPGKWIGNSPVPRGWLPRVGDPKAKECLFPDEDACLLTGRSVEPGKSDVPLLRRFAYGFLMREGMRTDEMAGLRWREVDLERGRVNLDENKTDDPRDWDLHPDTVEGLRRWKHLCGTYTEARDYVFADEGVPLNVEHLAEQLRRDLWRVGVRRPQLHERTKGRQRLRAHDLRATFVTIALATGKTETWISDRTGHRSHEMIETYRRRSRTWNLGELGRLCELIPELRNGVDWAANGQQLHRTGGEIGRRSGFRFRRRKA
jgi:integrase